MELFNSIALGVIMVCALILVGGLALLSIQLRETLDSTKQLIERINSKLDPLEKDVTDTFADARRTLEEVRAQAQSLGETNRLIRGRVEDFGGIVKFVATRVESPIVKTVTAAAGLRAGLKFLLESLRKRKEDDHHG